MADTLDYFHGKTLTDLARDLIQRSTGLNVGYNGNDPNPAATERNSMLGGPMMPNMGPIGNLLAGLQSVHQDKSKQLLGQDIMGGAITPFGKLNSEEYSYPGDKTNSVRLQYHDKEGNNIGFAAYDPTMKLSLGIHVWPQFRSKGYGTEILRDLRAQGVEEHVAGSPEGRKLLQNAGYKEVEPNLFKPPKDTK